MQENQSPDPIQSAVQAETVPHGESKLRSRIFEAGLLVFAIAFAILAFTAHNVPFLPLDLTIERFVQSYHPIWFLSLMEVVSWPGYTLQSMFLVLLTGALLYYLHLRWEAVVSVAGAAFVLLANTAVKLTVQRPRPNSSLVDVVRQLQGYSFPSGHVMFYTGFFGFLLFLTYILLKRSWKRTVLFVGFGLILILVGPSRIYLGAHWPSDVLGAYLLGSLALWAIIRFYNWGKSRRFFHEPGPGKPTRPQAQPEGQPEETRSP
jgi:undecaprenyl-diphosphatase